jgi:hypothetical protein
MSVADGYVFFFLFLQPIRGKRRNFPRPNGAEFGRKRRSLGCQNGRPGNGRPMTVNELFELLSNIVTVIGLPFAIVVFVLEQRKERANEEEEIFQRLSDEYREFLKLVLDNADLQLLRLEGARQNLSEEQKERRFAIFGILISLFERAYLLVYEETLNKKARRLWQSWEDYMREWVRRADFRDALPQLLEGEDEEFTQYIASLADAERKQAR